MTLTWADRGCRHLVSFRLLLPRRVAPIDRPLQPVSSASALPASNELAGPGHRWWPMMAAPLYLEMGLLTRLGGSLDRTQIIVVASWVAAQ